jgi:ElaB/YqjD/DUF883 family membrane-anchored ribosome-binding protein
MSSNFSNMSDTAAQVAGHASELGREAIDRLDASRPGVADSLERTADAIRSHAPATSGAATSVANALGTTAGYIRGRDIRTMGSDLTEFVRRNPGPSLVAAVATGFLLGAILRSSGRSSRGTYYG